MIIKPKKSLTGLETKIQTRLSQSVLQSKYLTGLIFALTLGWIFAAWPAILSFAQESTSTFQLETAQEEDIIEAEPLEIPAPPEPPRPQRPPLKERTLQKAVQLDKDARHSCAAKNFTINISNQNQIMTEFELTGVRSDFENLEIGSLPSGIDITFLNDTGYSWRPPKNEQRAALQITNQSGSQKGNFSVPIIYQSGDSTTICQINIINF